MADEPAKTETKLEDKLADKKEEQKTGADSKTIQVKVHATYKIYFDGPALSVSAINDTGPFDILPGHHNFMTLINQCDVVIRTEKDEQSIPITKGVMHVKANAVVVFLDV